MAHCTHCHFNEQCEKFTISNIYWPKQVLGNAVRILLHIWGIWLCCFFIYLGVKVMTLVKRMPKSVLQNFDSRHKGKCAMLTYNSRGSRIATTLTRKILRSDEIRFIFHWNENVDEKKEKILFMWRSFLSVTSFSLTL